MMMGDTESCNSTGSDSSNQRRKKKQKLEVCEEVSQRLKASANEEASQPGFEDELWNHFNRFSVSYATDVNVEQPEVVIMHMKLLHRAADPNARPAIEVRIVQVPVSDVSCSETVHSMSIMDPQTSDGSTKQKQDNNSRPACAFGLSPSLEVAVEADKSNGQGGGGGDGDGELQFFRHCFEITVSTIDKPKLLSQLTSALSDIGLNIEEAHAFSTSDGYSLDIFVVDGWSPEEAEQLKDKLESELPKIENQCRPNLQFKPPTKVLHQTGSALNRERVEIPVDDVDVWELDPNLLEFGEIIAAGSCKELYKGTYGSQDVAIKVLTAEYLNRDVQREFCQEVFILRKVRHKNVVQFIGACTKPPSLCIVTEFMSRGSVFDFLHKKKQIFQLPALLKVAIDVSKGMNYLHHNKIVHRDLKAANLLMDENDVVKVADFGVAKVQTPSGIMTAETGTYRWMAPEVIEHKPYDGKADVFSFGIVLWELLTGKVPYEHLTPLQAAVGVVQKGLRPTVPANTHPKLVALLKRCWQQNPSSRPEFSEIIEILNHISNEVTEERTVHLPKKKEEKIVMRMSSLGGSSKHADRRAVKKEESSDD